MFDFQVVEEALIAKEILPEIDKTGRDSQWRV